MVTGGFLITVFLFLSFAVSLDSYLSPVNEALRQTVFFCRLYAVECMVLSQLISDAAPILHEREIPAYTTMMNGTLFSPPHPSMARKEPSPENDAEWLQHVNATIFRLSREEVVKLGKDPNTAARLDPEYWGVDDDVYYGKFDITHVSSSPAPFTCRQVLTSFLTRKSTASISCAKRPLPGTLGTTPTAITAVRRAAWIGSI